MDINQLHATIKEMFPGCRVSVEHAIKDGLTPPEIWGAMVYAPQCGKCQCGRDEVIAHAFVWSTPEKVLEDLRLQRVVTLPGGEGMGCIERKEEGNV